MPAPSKVVQESMHFLLDELGKHCYFMGLFFKTHSNDELALLRSRQGYVKILREKVELECARVLQRRKPGTSFYNQVVAHKTLIIALSDLSSMSMACFDEIEADQPFIHPAQKLCIKLVRRFGQSINLVTIGVDGAPRRAGLKLARRTEKLLALYEQIQQETLSQRDRLDDRELRTVLHCNFGLKRLVTQLSVLGEALIKADVGQVATLKNYRHLKDAAASLNYNLDDVTVKRLALTRSGSAIASIAYEGNDNSVDVLAVYKEGDYTKIKEEVEGVAQWQKVAPDVAPEVLAHSSRQGETSSLLIEHLPGKTFEKLALAGDQSGTEKILKALFKTLNRIWSDTLTAESCNAHFMAQLQKRIGDSRSVHPKLFAPTQTICDVVTPGFNELIERVQAKEARWTAPFSVLVHGDFNVDNLIFNEAEKRLYFIDLHRSSYFDYVQDISVLMISLYRLQAPDKKTRKLMMVCIEKIARYARKFAQKHNDELFELRLAAGLARSFATSTRFIYDAKLASKMYFRSRYLLETLANMAPEQEAHYQLSLEELFGE